MTNEMTPPSPDAAESKRVAVVDRLAAEARIQCESRIGAVTPWYGSKRGMVNAIIEASGIVPADVTYYTEPFHGSGAVLLGLRECGMACPAIAGDMHRLMSNLMIVVSNREMSQQLMDVVATIPFHEAAFIEACDVLERKSIERRGREGQVTLAAAYLVATWMGRNGEAGTDRPWYQWADGFCVRWTATGGDPAVRWQSVKDAIPKWYRLLGEKTTFLLEPFWSVLNSTSDVDGAWIYLDPPYLRDTRGTTKYECDFEDATNGFREDEDDHSHLAKLAGKFTRATVSVSYYAHERLQRLYPPLLGWVHHDLSRNKNSAQAREGAEATTSPEVLIVRKGKGGTNAG
jgi:site-specific DNA-adenine methylase